MVIVEALRVQSLIGCHTSNTMYGSHLLATYRITEAYVVRCSVTVLWAAHALLIIPSLTILTCLILQLE